MEKKQTNKKTDNSLAEPIVDEVLACSSLSFIIRRKGYTAELNNKAHPFQVRFATIGISAPTGLLHYSAHT